MRKLFLFLTLTFGNIANCQSLSRLTNEEKIYGLSKMWQEVNYNFVFFNNINKLKWDSLYRSLISSVQNTKNDYEYYHELERFYAFLKDGHTNVINFPDYINDSLLNNNFGKYRIFVRNISNKAIIVRTNASIKNEIPIGSEITEVNGLRTKDYINKYVAPYISSSTDYDLQDESTALMFLGLKGDIYSIKIRTPDGGMKQLTLIHELTTEQEVYPPFKQFELVEFRWMENQIGYCAINTFGEPKVDTIFANLLPQLKKAKALIIDLRKNGGGNTDIGMNILKYLTNDTILYGSKSYTRLLNSTYKAWGKFVTSSDTLNNSDNAKYYKSYHDNYFYEFPYAPDTIKNRKIAIVIPTAILIGHQTSSAAEDFFDLCR